MHFITLKYFPLVLCFFFWDFRAGEMISFVFISKVSTIFVKETEGERTFVTVNTLSEELREGGRWGLCL